MMLFARVVGSVLLLLFAAGCAHKLAAPTATPTGDQAPVGLRNFEVTNVDGHRAVLLRLSRSPTMIRQSSAKKPGQIIVQAWGPVGDGDMPERLLPQIDPLINDVRVSRHDGTLQIVLDFKADEPPPYSVHEMADWIMIRLGVPEQG